MSVHSEMVEQPLVELLRETLRITTGAPVRIAVAGACISCSWTELYLLHRDEKQALFVEITIKKKKGFLLYRYALAPVYNWNVQSTRLAA